MYISHLDIYVYMYFNLGLRYDFILIVVNLYSASIATHKLSKTTQKTKVPDAWWGSNLLPLDLSTTEPMQLTSVYEIGHQWIIQSWCRILTMIIWWLCTFLKNVFTVMCIIHKANWSNYLNESAAFPFQISILHQDLTSIWNVKNSGNTPRSNGLLAPL